MSGKRASGVTALSVVWLLGASALAGDYVLSFQERDGFDKWIPHDISGVEKTLNGERGHGTTDRYGAVISERTLAGRKSRGKHFLQVLVNGQEVYLKDVGQGGPLYHEQVKFSAADPSDVSIAFRLLLRADWSEGLSIHIGNIRVKDAKGGEVRMDGKWGYEESRPEMYGHFFPSYHYPYHTGFSLNAPKRSLKAGDNCTYVWQGGLEDVPNLVIRRLSEFVGCYEKLGYHDDYRNISFEPGDGQIPPGKEVKVQVKFFNQGSALARAVDVALYVDGKEHGRQKVNLAACSEGAAEWTWNAEDGVHSFLVRLDPENKIDESREDDNFMLRLLDTQGRRKTDRTNRYDWFGGKRYGPEALGYPPEPVGAGFSQGSYIRACDVWLDGLTGSRTHKTPGDDDALNFGINAFYEEVIRPCLDPHGYYREGLGYYDMAEDRKGAICWKQTYDVTKVSFFELWPIVAEMHRYPIRLRMPDGHHPPINDLSRGRNGYPYWKHVAHLFGDEEDRAVARWDGDMPDGQPPQWNPTQLLTTHQVFRTDWGPEASYVLLSTKHWPAGSRSHDEVDQNSFVFYAKKAFLAIDPGYGQPIHKPVKKWCRESPYAHNMILADGEVPPHRHPDVDISVYTYGNPAYPENRFSTWGLDFAESAMYDWETEKGALITTRRSVIFPKSRDYFVLVDSVKSTTGEEHEYEFLLHGDARRPFYGKHRQDRSRPGDYVWYQGANWAAVPLASNLQIVKTNGAQEAVWTVENMDGKDVKYRALFALPRSLQCTADDGWSGYWYLWAARIKYLKAKQKARDVRFLTVHIADLVEDPGDDIQAQAVAVEGANRGAVKLALPGGRTALVATQDGGQVLALPAGKDSLETDAEIAFVQADDTGLPEKLLLVRGSSLRRNGKLLLECSAPAEVLGVSCPSAKKDLEGYVGLEQPGQVTITIALPKAPKQVLFRGQPVTFSYRGGRLEMKVLGSGHLKASF